MNIRFLAISGSERNEGNTYMAIEFARNIIEENGCTLEVISLKDMNIVQCSNCTECENCNFKETPCDQNDDVYGIFEKMQLSDCIIYAAPVHGFGISSLMQNFIERMGVGYLRFERPLTNKLGGVIVIGRRYSHDAIFAQITKNFFLNRMILVGSGFPAFLNGGRPGEIFQDNEGIDSIHRMVLRLIQMAIWIKRSEKALGESIPIANFENERNFISKSRQSKSELVQLKLNIDTSVGDSTPIEATREDPSYRRGAYD